MFIRQLFKNSKKNFSWNSLQQSVNSIKEAQSSFLSANKIKEFDETLTEDQKKNLKRFLIYRSEPGQNPYLMSYYLDLEHCNPMYLDAIIKIKDEMDASLSFRRSCREGVCGSCAMNVDGFHTLACIKYIDQDLSKPALITPLGHLMVIKDLVVDMTNFYAQYRSIQPYLQRKNVKKDDNKEYHQSIEDRELLDGLYECVMCASCSTSCPSYWWNPTGYLGPAVLMQAYRWIVDSRDEFTDERLNQLSQGSLVEDCQNIGICTFTCPKGLDPQKSIQHLLSMVKDFRERRDSINDI